MTTCSSAAASVAACDLGSPDTSTRPIRVQFCPRAPRRAGPGGAVESGCRSTVSFSQWAANEANAAIQAKCPRRARAGAAALVGRRGDPDCGSTGVVCGSGRDGWCHETRLGHSGPHRRDGTGVLYMGPGVRGAATQTAGAHAGCLLCDTGVRLSHGAARRGFGGRASADRLAMGAHSRGSVGSKPDHQAGKRQSGRRDDRPDAHQRLGLPRLPGGGSLRPRCAGRLRY